MVSHPSQSTRRMGHPAPAYSFAPRWFPGTRFPCGIGFSPRLLLRCILGCGRLYRDFASNCSAARQFLPDFAFRPIHTVLLCLVKQELSRSIHEKHPPFLSFLYPLVDCPANERVVENTFLSPTFPVGRNVPVKVAPERHRNVTIGRWPGHQPEESP